MDKKLRKKTLYGLIFGMIITIIGVMNPRIYEYIKWLPTSDESMKVLDQLQNTDMQQ